MFQSHFVFACSAKIELVLLALIPLASVNVTTIELCTSYNSVRC